MRISKFFSDEARLSMREAIREAGGNEVFFVGTVNDEGVVTAVQAMARGTQHEVVVHRAAARECDALIHNHPGGDLSPSEPDMLVASDCAEKAQAFYIVNNSVSEVYVVVEPILARKIKPLDVDEAAMFLSDGGALASQSKNFEMRPSQVNLLRKISETFNENKIGVFEAGTGVGKSYAYLVPSILWAAENKERVVVSTGTINLQQQLCEKDIPQALKITGKKIKAILLKGRQNYVSRRRLQSALADRDLFSEDAEIIEKIGEWAESSATGSRSELPFQVTDSAWSRVRSESDACMGMRCPFFRDCFVMKTRKEAADAQIIVVNHHLLFADIESRLSGAGYEDAAVLPPYKRLIFDEAHTIEGAATSFFSETTNRFQIMKNVNLLYRKRRGGATGHLTVLSILAAADNDEDKLPEVSSLADKIKSSIENLETAALDLLAGDYTFRLSERTARLAHPLLSLSATLAGTLGQFVATSREILDAIDEEDRTLDAYWEARLVLRRLDDSIKLLNDFGKWDEMGENVFWLQKKMLSPEAQSRAASQQAGTGSTQSGIYITFTETPLDISARMTEGVFEPMSSVVCASATLSVGRSFNFWIARTGLRFTEAERLLKGEFASPFPYKKNMVFAVPKDAPLPERSVDFEQFVCAAVPRLISAAEGRTLVLFTSYDSLKNTFRASLNSLKHAHNFSGTLLKQGDDDSARLLEKFKNDESSVLFATDSFWQGVDVPGKSLSQVIIVKLPFSVPSDPVFAARSEAVEKRGGNPFMELSVPEAVMKFRQGIGRLVRRSDDKGAVVLLDRRVYEKRYGSIFISSVPDCPKVYEPLEKIADRVSELIAT